MKKVYIMKKMNLMRNDPKRKIAEQARLICGIMNVLSDDIKSLRTDANDYDFINLSESINITKETLQVLTDNVISLEYMLYLFEKEGS